MKGDKFYSGAHGNLSFHSFGTFNVGPGAVNSVQYVGEVPVGTAVTRAIIDVTAVTGNIANGARLDIGLVQKDLVDREPGQFTDDPDAFVDNHDPAVGTLVKELTDFAIVDEPDVWLAVTIKGAAIAAGNNSVTIKPALQYISIGTD